MTVVQLLDADIQTREVLGWTGLHLFHFPMSSCSQKLRIYLQVKGIQWTPHQIDLSAHESYAPWFMGINPQGMVPVLVIDGAVHIESNEILALLEDRYPSPVLWPTDRADDIRAQLAVENALHHDLRLLSFRFVHGRTTTTKTAEMMAAYRAHGRASDPKKRAELDFYETLAAEGLSDARCRQAAAKFRAAFDVFEQKLAIAPYLAGEAISVLDIAWFVYAYRLVLGGYPLGSLHPRVDAWYRALAADPTWEREVAPGQALKQRIDASRRSQQETGATLGAVAGF